MKHAVAAALLLVLAGTAAAQTLTDDPAFVLYRQALDALAAKDYDGATRLATEAIAQYPDHLLAYYLLGQASMSRNAWEDAVQAFTNVVKRYPASFAAHRDLGLALEHLNRVEEARAAFEAALARRPDNADVRLRLAYMLFEKGQKDAAVPHLETLARDNSRAPEVWLMLARARYEKSDLPGSEKAFARAAELRDEGKTWFNLAVVRLRLNDQPGATAAFKRATEHTETREQALRELERLKDAAKK